MFHLNPVLPEEVPIHLDVIMANTGWDPVQAKFKEKNWDLIQHMNRQEREKVVPEECEREVIHTHQRTRGEADCQYLESLTYAAIRHCQEAKKWTEKRGGRRWQTSQARCVESCHRDKQRLSHHRTPPMEKTLTNMIPQHLAPTSLERLRLNHTTSERETTGPDPAEEEQGSEAEPPPPADEDQPEWISMPELCSEDEDDPLDEDKFRPEERVHVASLQHLALLVDMP